MIIQKYLNSQDLTSQRQKVAGAGRKNGLPIIGFHYLTALLVFCITIDYRLPGSFTLVEVLSYVFILFYGMNTLLTNGKLHRAIISAYTENKVVFFYFFWIFIDMVMAISFREYPRYNISYFRNIIPSIVVYFLVVSTIKDKKRFQLLTSFYLAGVIVNVLVGLSQALSGWPEIVPGNWATTMKMDSSGAVVTGHVVRGFFSHPNAFAGFFIPSALLVITLIFRDFSSKKIVNFLFRILLSVCLFLIIKSTYAKGVMFWIPLGIIFLFLPRPLNKWRLYLGIFSASGSIVALTLYGLAESAKSGGALGTIQTRVDLWRAALAAMQEDNYILLFGNGNAAVLKLSNVYSNIVYPNAHNGVLNQVIFYGVLGLVFYLWIIIDSLKRLSNLIEKRQEFTYSTALFIFSSLIATLGNLFFEPFSEGVPLQAQLFFLIALTTIMNRPTFDEVDV